MNKILLYFLISNIPVYATEALYDKNEEIQNALNSNMYTPNYLTMLLGLGIVIGLIYITAVLYQKLVKIKISDDSGQEDKINIISSASLGQGKNLHVIKVNNVKMIIGATQNNISYLKTINENYVSEDNHAKWSSNRK